MVIMITKLITGGIEICTSKFNKFNILQEYVFPNYPSSYGRYKYDMNLKCVTFNCFGFKNSSSFINSLCESYDICFLNEHWLKPYEIGIVKEELKGRNLWSFLKSSMDPEQIQKGRSYGGVGFVCKQQNELVYMVIETDNDSICALQVIRHQSVILTVTGVYMPYFNGNIDQTQQYIETFNFYKTFLIHILLVHHV